MMRAALGYLLAGVPAPPPLGRALWATLGVLVLGALNLAFASELWPHTPGAVRALQVAAGLALLLLLLLPQLAWWAGCWLWACAGPWWLLGLAKAGFLLALLPVALGWVALVVLWLL